MGCNQLSCKINKNKSDNKGNNANDCIKISNSIPIFKVVQIVIIKVFKKNYFLLLDSRTNTSVLRNVTEVSWSSEFSSK